MTTQDTQPDLELSRRRLLAAAGIVGGVALSASFVGAVTTRAAPAAPPCPDPLATPPVTGLHLQFGTDPSSEMVVSWHSLPPVRNARVMLGSLDGKLDRVVEAEQTNYTDAKLGQIVYAYYASIAQLRSDIAYLYGAIHDGADPEFTTFHTAPRGRARFIFTSFGDQATPTDGKRYKPPEGVTIANLPL
jgi:hypothetical protein